MPGISGPGGVSQIVCGPSDRILENGDILFIDTGSTFDGYFCDFDRNFAFGSVSSDVERVNEVLSDYDKEMKICVVLLFLISSLIMYRILKNQ